MSSSLKEPLISTLHRSESEGIQEEGSTTRGGGENHPTAAYHDDDDQQLLVVVNRTSPAEEEEELVEQQQVVMKQARLLLYVSHLFTQFSARSWHFCLVLFLAGFSKYQSFLSVSTYGVTSGLAVCLLGAKAGRLLDLSNRLYAAETLIWSKHLCVLLAAFCCYCLLSKNIPTDDQTISHQQDDNEAEMEKTPRTFGGIPLDFTSLSLLIAIHLLGSAGSVLDTTFTVAIERDWIVVMSRFVRHRSNNNNNNNDELTSIWLSETNVTLRQIDLICKVASPAVIGVVLAAMKSLKGGAVVVGGLTLLALSVEYISCRQIYDWIPDLAERGCDDDGTPSPTATATDNNDDETPLVMTTTTTTTTTTPNEQMIGDSFCKSDKFCGSFFSLPVGLAIFMDQSVCMAGIGLSLLYLNVLSFGAIMTAYLVWRGMSVDAIGFCRGTAAVIGLVGTCVYHLSVKRFSVMDTGMGSILTQFICLSLSYASLFVQDDTIALTMLIVGVCLSRVGLYAFDIAVTQLFQEHTPDEIRSVVGGVQQSLNAFFGILSYAIGLFFPDPNDFFIYGAVGYLSVGFALILFAWRVYFRREHIETTISCNNNNNNNS